MSKNQEEKMSNKELIEKDKERKKRAIIGVVLAIFAIIFILGAVAVSDKENRLKEGSGSKKVIEEKITETSDEKLTSIEDVDSIGGKKGELSGEYQQFIPIKVEDLDKLSQRSILNESKSYLYVGRPTCPDCREFVPLLNKVVDEEEVEIYYLNTDDYKGTEEGKTKLSEVLLEYGISEIPVLSYFEDGSYVKMDREGYGNVDKIKDFLTNK